LYYTEDDQKNKCRNIYNYFFFIKHNNLSALTIKSGLTFITDAHIIMNVLIYDNKIYIINQYELLNNYFAVFYSGITIRM